MTPVSGLSRTLDYAILAAMKTLTPISFTALVSSVFLGLIAFSPISVYAEKAKQEKAIEGEVTIAPSLKAKISSEAALYVIARPNGVNAGPPLAVKRFASPLMFPIHFSITSQDAMIPGTSLNSELSLIARISQKGSATPANPGDLQTSKPMNGVKAGGKTVALEINEERK
jgi:hypothetical protein